MPCIRTPKLRRETVDYSSLQPIIDCWRKTSFTATTIRRRKRNMLTFVESLDSYKPGSAARFLKDKDPAMFYDEPLWDNAVKALARRKDGTSEAVALDTLKGALSDVIATVELLTDFAMPLRLRKKLDGLLSAAGSSKPRKEKLPFSREDFQNLILATYAPDDAAGGNGDNIQMAALFLLLAYCAGRPCEFVKDDNLSPGEGKALKWKNVQFYVGCDADGGTVFRAIISFDNLKGSPTAVKRMTLYEEKPSTPGYAPYMDPIWPLLALALVDEVFQDISSVDDLRRIDAHAIDRAGKGCLPLLIKPALLNDHVFRSKRSADASGNFCKDPLTYRRGQAALRRVSSSPSCRFKVPISFADLRRFVSNAVENAGVKDSDRRLMMGHSHNSLTFEKAYKNPLSRIDLQSILQGREQNVARAMVNLQRERFHGPLSPEQVRSIKISVRRDAQVKAASRELEKAPADQQETLRSKLKQLKKNAKAAVTLQVHEEQAARIDREILRGAFTTDNKPVADERDTTIPRAGECSTHENILAEFVRSLQPVKVPRASPLTNELRMLLTRSSREQSDRFGALKLMIATLQRPLTTLPARSAQSLDIVLKPNVTHGKAHQEACMRKQLKAQYTSHPSYAALYGSKCRSAVEVVTYCANCDEWFIGEAAVAKHKASHAAKSWNCSFGLRACPFCLHDGSDSPWTFCSQTSLRRHVWSKHDGTDGGATCPFPSCDMSVPSQELARHLEDLHDFACPRLLKTSPRKPRQLKPASFLESVSDRSSVQDGVFVSLTRMR